MMCCVDPAAWSRWAGDTAADATDSDVSDTEPRRPAAAGMDSEFLSVTQLQIVRVACWLRISG